jgi:tetratricopeptide (TPR) repeat protein
VNSSRYCWASLMLCSSLIIVGCGKSSEQLAKEAEAARVVAEQEAKTKREQRFQELVAQGQQSLDAKRYDTAVEHLQQAVALQDDSATLALLQQAKKGRDEARKVAFDAAMVRGKQAETNKDYTGAVAAYRDALTCLAENAEATLALRNAEFMLYREKGQTATQTQQYATAIQAFGEALKRRPNDPETQTLLDQAKVAHEAALKAAFDAAVARAKLARDMKNYAGAMTAYREALAAVPNNAEATAALRDVTFLNHRDRGRTAIQQRKPLDAIKELTDALKLEPNDQDARDLYQDAKALRRDELLADGKTALTAKRYTDAIRYFTDAQQFSNDPTITELLAEAKFLEKRDASRKLLDGGQYLGAISGFEDVLRVRPNDAESRAMLAKAIDAKKKQDRRAYDKLIETGKSHVAANRFDDAVTEFEKARKLLPDQSEPASLIRETETKKREWQAKKRDFDRLISSGKSELQRKRYDDAIRDFQAAERLEYNSTEAKKLLREAEEKKKKDEKKQ